MTALALVATLLFAPAGPLGDDCIPAAGAVYGIAPEVLRAIRHVEGRGLLNPTSRYRPQPWSPKYPWAIAGPWQVTHGRYGHLRAEILTTSMCAAAFDAAKYLRECLRMCGRSRYLECWHEGPSARFHTRKSFTRRVKKYLLQRGD